MGFGDFFPVGHKKEGGSPSWGIMRGGGAVGEEGLEMSVHRMTSL